MIERFLNWFDRRLMAWYDRRMQKLETLHDEAPQIRLALLIQKTEAKYTKVRHRYLGRRYKSNPIGALKAGYAPTAERKNRN